MNEQQWDQFLHRTLHTEDNIDHVPQIVRQRVENTLASLPDQRIMKQSTQLTKIVASIVSILLVITFSFAYFSPVVAKYLSQIPVIGSAFDWAGDPGIKSNMNKNLFDPIGQTVEDQGITITLDQIIYDGTRLSVGLVHDEAIRINPNRPGSLKVNGADVLTSFGVGSNQGQGGLMATVYTFTPEDPYPSKFDMTLTLDEVHIIRDGQTRTINGKWQFKTSVRKITDGITVRTFKPPLTKSFEGTTVSITGLTLTPVTIKVAFDLIQSEKYDNPHLHNKVKPEFVDLHQLYYELMDEQGLYLENLSSGGSGMAGEAMKYSALFTPLTNESNVLTFQVVEQTIRMRKIDEDSYGGADTPKVIYTELPQEFPLTIQQGEVGEITFNRIIFESQQTWVEYEVHGKDPHDQDSAWWIENEKGERFRFERYDQIRTSDDVYAYRTKLPPMDPNDSLKIAVIQLKKPNLLKELEFRIPIGE